MAEDKKIGKTISRAEALKISRETLERAENARRESDEADTKEMFVEIDRIEKLESKLWDAEFEIEKLQIELRETKKRLEVTQDALNRAFGDIAKLGIQILDPKRVEIELDVLWKNYALADDSTLDPGATELKNALLVLAESSEIFRKYQEEHADG